MVNDEFWLHQDNISMYCIPPLNRVNSTTIKGKLGLQGVDCGYLLEPPRWRF